MGRIAVIKRRTDMGYGVRPFKPEVTALQHGDFKDEDLHDEEPGTLILYRHRRGGDGHRPL